MEEDHGKRPKTGYILDIVDQAATEHHRLVNKTTAYALNCESSRKTTGVGSAGYPITAQLACIAIQHIFFG